MCASQIFCTSVRAGVCDSAMSELRHHGFAKLIGGRAATLVGGQRTATRIHPLDGCLQGPRRLTEAEILEHHRRRENRRRGVHLLGLEVRGCSMHRLEIRIVAAVAAARSKAQAAGASESMSP